MPKPFAPPRLIGAATLVLCVLALAAALPAGALAAPGPLPLVVSPSPAIFPTTVVGEKTRLEIDVANEGEEAPIEKIAVEGPGAAEFSGASSNCGALGEGQHCTVTIDFAPTSPGAKQASALIRFGGGGRAEESFELSGAAVAPHLSFSPSSYDFGFQQTNSEAASTIFQVKNDSGASEQIDSVDLAGANNDGFGFDGSDCWGATLAAGQACSVQVWFGPGGTGPYTNLLRVKADGQDFSAEVSGIGVQPEVEATPNPVEFGSAGVGAAGPTRTVTLTNVGVVPTAYFIAIVSGGDSASFRLLDESCTGVEIDPGESCRVHVRFAPLGAGPSKATLSMFGNNDGPMQIPLAGEGIAPALTLTPASLDFGEQAAGGRSAPRAFTVRNEGGAPIELGAAAIAGPNLDQFVLSGEDCAGATLGAGEACTVRVRFAPDSAGAKAARLHIPGEGVSLTASLAGTGAAAPSAPSRVDFHWRGVSHRWHGGRRLRAGSARCSGPRSCLVTVTTKLSIVRRPRNGLTETQVASLPKLRVRIAANRVRALDISIPRAVLALLGRGRATLDIKAKWSTAADSGRVNCISAVR